MGLVQRVSSRVVLLSVLVCAPSLGLPAPGVGRGGAVPPSFVIVLADDMGIDNVGAYRAHPRPARTPNLDRFAGSGMLFRQAYAHPVCSPSRASLLTGRHGSDRHVRIGSILRQHHTYGGLGVDVRTLPDALGPAWRRVVLGKWHLGDRSQVLAVPTHPVELGFDTHRITWFNLQSQGDTYSNFKVWREDGIVEQVFTYATTAMVDEAIAELQDTSRPLFLYLALHAPHAPFHWPPTNLHGVDTSVDDNVRKYKAMVEALDTEFGRFLDALDASPFAGSTYVFFMGDNGTPKEVTTAPWSPDRAKTTPYEGGVHVPLLVRGPGVPAAVNDALVGITDLFATVTELAGVPAEAPESVSMVPYFRGETRSLRQMAYAERWGANGFTFASTYKRMARNHRYALVSFHDTPDELYDLVRDPLQTTDLLSEGLRALPPELQLEYTGLRTFLDGISPGVFD